MMKCNEFQSNNKKDLKIVYIIGACIYLIIGILGGIGLERKISS